MAVRFRGLARTAGCRPEQPFDARYPSYRNRPIVVGRGVGANGSCLGIAAIDCSTYLQLLQLELDVH